MIRGAFEFQGQKCSAASRAYVPRSVWNRIKDDVISQTESITMGDVTDLSNFMGAVIDDRAFAKHKAAIARVRRNKHLTLLAGGQTDDSVGYFVRPTIVQSTDPTDQMFNTEYFGPILAVHVYDDARYERVVQQMESFAPYALTGAVIAQDREAIAWTQDALRFAAGNFYINDKPTGAVVGPAAVRRRPCLRHQRQGRRRRQPAPLDLPALHQGDLRPAEGLEVPLHGLSRPLVESRRAGDASRDPVSVRGRVTGLVTGASSPSSTSGRCRRATRRRAT